MQLTKDQDVYITTEVGQHQMWAAQFFQLRGAQPLDDLGRARHHGLRPAGRRSACRSPIPTALVIDIAGEASVLMTMQEMSTAVQYDLPVKIFILNNECMGMVRQWQQLLHGERYSHSYIGSAARLREAGRGLSAASACAAENPAELDDAISEMIDVNAAGDLRLPGRQARELLPDDPVGQGAQRDAARRGRAARARSSGDRRKARCWCRGWER